MEQKRVLLLQTLTRDCLVTKITFFYICKVDEEAVFKQLQRRRSEIIFFSGELGEICESEQVGGLLVFTPPFSVV